MKSKLLFISFFFLLFIPVSFGQTVIEGGDVSGNWTKSAAPYLIRGEINVPVDQTLTIEPGVTIKFEGYYKFNIYGCLIAEGALFDSIIFTTDDEETGWHGLRFQETKKNSQPVSKITFCVVEYGKASGSCPDNRGGGIYILRSDPVISHCCIRNNRSVGGAGTWGGGGIYCEFSTATIDSNLICNNYTDHDGGGIYCYASPVIKNNRIINNKASFRGGGIATFLFSSPDILNNVVAGNHAGSMGGGIYQDGGASLIQSNVISGNSSGKGGGIANNLAEVQGKVQQIYNNLITDNEAGYGAGIWNQGSSPKLFNNTIVRNNATYKGGGMMNLSEVIGPFTYYSEPLTANNIVYYNTAGEGHQIYSDPDNVPVLWYNNIEGLSGDGISGDIDDREGNIDIVPGFDSEAEHDCELLGGSACIDNGISNVAGFDLPPTDILGNVRIWDGDNDGQPKVDMGAYEYGSSPLGIPDLQAGTRHLNFTVSPNPFTNSITVSFNLDNRQQVTISIQDLSGRQLEVLKNQNLDKGNYDLIFHPGSFAPGIYLIGLKTGSGLKAVKKVIKTGY